MNQSEIIKQMSSEQLKKQIIFSQMLFIFISIILSYFLFESIFDWFNYFHWDWKEVFLYGVIPGLLIVIIDLIAILFLPKNLYDDGGINEKIFKDRSILDIFIIAMIVAVSEELLFRGVFQTTFGYIFASILFALVHFRYLKKPVLLISIIFVSFYIGYLFKMTGSLYVTITAHFIVDFILGLFIRFQR